MLIINVAAGTAVYKEGATKPETAQEGVYYIGEKADVVAMPTTDIVQAYNTIAKSKGMAEVARFSDRSKAEARLFGLYLSFINDSFKPKAMKKAEAKAAKPKKEKKAKTPKPPKEKKAKTPKEKKERGPRMAKDVELKGTSKTIDPRKGSVQEKQLRLISRENGISIEQMVKEMNEGPGSARFTVGNIWSSLKSSLHDQHGYGIARRGGRFYLL